MKTITIEGRLRSGLGKKATRQLRSEQQVPCVIYGGPDTVNFQAPVGSFKDLIYTPDFQTVSVKLEGKTYPCVLKDKQFDPISDQLNHVDFLELIEDRRVMVNIPIKFMGIPVGVKGGGKLTVKMKSIRVKTLPKYLKEHIEINVENLNLNENIRVEDVREEGFEILNSPRIPIASVGLTRVLKQEEAAATPTPTPAPAAPAAPAVAAPAPAPAKGKGPGKGKPSK